MTDTKEIVKKQESNIVMPVVSAEEAVEAWNKYIELKKRIVQPEDVQTIQGKDFLKKSYWRKVANFFNISVEIIKEEKEVITPQRFAYHFTCKATASNGRFTYGSGSCDNFEKGRANTIHNTRTTAETRAFNRSVSNLLGGEVSAEEIVVDNHEPEVINQEPAKEVKKTPATVDFVCKFKGCGKVLSPKELQFSKEYCYQHQKKS